MKMKTGFKMWLGMAFGGIALLAAVLFFVPIGDEEALKFHAGSVESSSNISTSSLTCGNDSSFFAAHRVLVLNRSDHPLMKKAAAQLVEQLLALPYVDQVDMCTSKETAPAIGEPLYDFYVLLEMPSINVHGLLPFGRTVKAEVRMSCGPSLFFSRHTYSDNCSACMANVSMESTLGYEGRVRGVESAHARYEQDAKAVAE